MSDLSWLNPTPQAIAVYASSPLSPAALSPVRALPVRIPLGPRPSLHRLRGGLLRFVRRLQFHYGVVRLQVRERVGLRIIAFPMRTLVLGTHSIPTARPETSQLPMRSLCTSCCL